MGRGRNVQTNGVFMIKTAITDGWYIWEPDYFLPEQSDAYFGSFLAQLPWRGGEVQLFGKTFQIPRKQVYFADEGKAYSYSGKSLHLEPWNNEVNEIKEKLNQNLGHHFNACLANLYRDGNDSNGWHSDDEKELGINPIIASLSFGTTRAFQLKHKTTDERLNFELTHGSLLVMGGEMQHHWKHQLPKRKGVHEPRVNLTFRKIISPKP